MTKVEPWVDDFTDGSITDDGWTVNAGTWSVSSGAAQFGVSNILPDEVIAGNRSR